MKSKIILVYLVTLICFSCSLDSENQIATNSPIAIDSVYIPDTIVISEEAAIYAKTFDYDGCWSNLHFELKKTKNFEYELNGLGDYFSNGICPQNAFSSDTTILFKTETTGKYFFRIRKTPKTVILDSMVVESVGL